MDHSSLVKKIKEISAECGAQKYECFFQSSKNVSLELKDKKPFKNEASETFTLLYRVFDNQSQFGFSKTSLLSNAAIKKCIQSAQSLCGMGNAEFYKAPNPYSRSADPTLPNSVYDLTLSSTQELYENLSLSIDALLKVDGHKLECYQNDLSHSISLSTYLNSLGAQRSQSRDHHALYLTARSHTNSGIPRIYYETKKFLQPTKDELIHFGTTVGQKNLEYLTIKNVETGMFPVIFSPRAFLSLIRGFHSLWNAQEVLEGNSLMKRGDLGKLMFSPHFTLIDQPSHQGCISAPFFDSEGTTVQDSELVKNGFWNQMTHSLYTSQKMDLPPLGHGSMGPKPSAHFNFPVVNAHSAPTKLELEKLYKERFVFVEDVRSLHSGLRASEGTFSLPFTGFVGDGQSKSSFELATISGKILDILNQISVSSNECYVLPQGVSPHLGGAVCKITGTE